MLEFLVTISLVLLLRLIAFSADSPTRWLRLTFQSIACWMGSWILLDTSWHGLPLILLIVSAAFLFTERIDRIRIIARALSLLFIIIASAHLIMSYKVGFRPWVMGMCDLVRSGLVFGPELYNANWRRILAWAAGILLCLDEANMLIRAILKFLGIHAPIPESVGNGIDAKPASPKHSALIGNLERILIFVFVINGAYNAVGFILTAKGLVRFHELHQGEMVSYVLVGTLLSTIVAIGCALLSQTLV